MTSAPFLARVQASNESWFSHLDNPQARFRAVLHPVNPTQLPTSIFVLPRIALRCRLKEPVTSGLLVKDMFSRVLLVADHDLTLSASSPTSKVFACFQMTDRLSWSRDVQMMDPVTKEPVSTSTEDLGMIWASIENYTRTDNDAGLRFQTNRLRCITDKPLQLNDMVGGKTVKRVDYTLGVYVTEID